MMESWSWLGVNMLQAPGFKEPDLGTGIAKDLTAVCNFSDVSNSTVSASWRFITRLRFQRIDTQSCNELAFVSQQSEDGNVKTLHSQSQSK